MISAILGAWITYKPLIYAVVVLAMLGSYETWKYHERSIGAEKIEAAIQKKADDNAQHAENVREVVQAGRVRGRPDPYGVRP